MLKNVVRRKCRKELQKLIRMEQFFLLLKYSKIPKISPGAYIFQRPFLRGLFLEGLIFGGAYVRREICLSKSIGLACSGKEIYHFCFVLLCIRSKFHVQAPGGGLYSEGFLRYDFEGLIQSNPAISKSQGKWKKVRNGGVSK